MNAMALGRSVMSTLSNVNLGLRARMASRTVLYWVLHTESTATGMRLNSSKQPQAPVWARPLYVCPMAR